MFTFAVIEEIISQSRHAHASALSCLFLTNLGTPHTPVYGTIIWKRPYVRGFVLWKHVDRFHNRLSNDLLLVQSYLKRHCPNKLDFSKSAYNKSALRRMSVIYSAAHRSHRGRPSPAAGADSGAGSALSAQPLNWKPATAGDWVRNKSLESKASTPQIITLLNSSIQRPERQRFCTRDDYGVRLQSFECNEVPAQRCAFFLILIRGSTPGSYVDVNTTAFLEL